jgi:hypothetical protein
MAVFSSTENTAAWAGGWRYRPMMSAALLSKSGSLESHVALDPMRLETVLAPHTCHHHVTYFQMRGEFARAPVGLQNPRFHLRRQRRISIYTLVATRINRRSSPRLNSGSAHYFVYARPDIQSSWRYVNAALAPVSIFSASRPPLENQPQWIHPGIPHIVRRTRKRLEMGGRT